MFNTSCELNSFLEIPVNNISVLCNLDVAFAFRCSEIMNEFRGLSYDYSFEEIQKILKKKYDADIAKRFFKKLDLYRNFLFKKTAVSDFPNDKCFTILTLNVIHSCNMRCKYCFEEIEFRRDTQVMSRKIAFKSIDIFFNQLNGEVGHIIFTGGEPILNFPLIKEIINYIKNSKYKMTYMIKTNGTLIDENIMDFLIDNNFQVQISLDGCKEANDMNRVYTSRKGTYEDVIDVIDRFIKKGYMDKLSIHGTVTHKTIKYLNESLRIMHKKYKGLSFEVKEVMDSSNSNFLLTDEDRKEYLRCQLEKQLLTDFDEKELLKSKYICGIGKWHISVDTNGDLYPCYRLSGKREFKMGNVNDGKFVKSDNQKLNEIYNLYKSPRCRKCYTLSACTTGCYADKILVDNEQLCRFSYKKSIEDCLMDYFSDINKVALIPKI